MASWIVWELLEKVTDLTWMVMRKKEPVAGKFALMSAHPAHHAATRTARKTPARLVTDFKRDALQLRSKGYSFC